MVEKARQQKVFSREDTPLRRRVLTVFLYHASLLYRRIEPFVDCSFEPIRQWFHRLEHFFEPNCQARQEAVVDDTKIEMDGRQALCLGSSRL